MIALYLFCAIACGVIAYAKREIESRIGWALSAIAWCVIAVVASRL